MPYDSHESYMQRAFDLAEKGHAEGGCPIGAVLVDNASGRVLGEGHNALVQEGNPIIHGEMAALRNAGRMKNRHNTTMYTTLQPCLCARRDSPIRHPPRSDRRRHQRLERRNHPFPA